jgi:hypothetical protein
MALCPKHLVNGLSVHTWMNLRHTLSGALGSKRLTALSLLVALLGRAQATKTVKDFVSTSSSVQPVLVLSYEMYRKVRRTLHMCMRAYRVVVHSRTQACDLCEHSTCMVQSTCHGASVRCTNNAR